MNFFMVSAGCIGAALGLFDWGVIAIDTVPARFRVPGSSNLIVAGSVIKIRNRYRVRERDLASRWLTSVQVAEFRNVTHSNVGFC